MTGDADLPVWLLDVDGVINAVPGSPELLPGCWPAEAWSRHKVAGFPILTAAPVLAFLREVHRRGAAEIRWHTTWQDKAVEDLSPVLDLPVFPVAIAPEYRDAHLRPFDWWKVGAARRVVHDEGRRLVWTDDDLTWCRSDVRTAGISRTNAHLVSPSTREGLTPAHLRSIAGYLGRGFAGLDAGGAMRS